MQLDVLLIKVISFEIVTEYKYQVTRYFTHVEILNKIMLLEGDLTEIVTDYKHCDLATCHVVMLWKCNYCLNLTLDSSVDISANVDFSATVW